MASPQGEGFSSHLNQHIARNPRMGRALRDAPLGNMQERLAARQRRFGNNLQQMEQEAAAKAQEQATRFQRFADARKRGIDYGGAFEKHRDDPPYDEIADVNGWRNFIDHVVENAQRNHVSVNADGVAEIDLSAFLPSSRQYARFAGQLGRGRQTIACEIHRDGVKVFHVGPFG